MIHVYLRREGERKGVPLCEWPADRLDDLIPTIKRWGIHDEIEPTLYGQFFLDDASAHFEVVIAEDEEDDQ
jgi:hypothetical protein